MNLPEGLRFDDYEPVRIQIVNFIKDYAKLAGVSKAVLGLSGGIDSSLVAALACEAIGPENVLGIMMPVDAKKDAKNIADAKLVAETLDMPYEKITNGHMVCKSKSGESISSGYWKQDRIDDWLFHQIW